MLVCRDYSFDSWEEVEQFLEEAYSKGYVWLGEESDDFDAISFLRSNKFSLEHSSLNLWIDGDITFEVQEEEDVIPYVKGILPVHRAD